MYTHAFISLFLNKKLGLINILYLILNAYSLIAHGHSIELQIVKRQ